MIETCFDNGVKGTVPTGTIQITYKRTDASWDIIMTEKINSGRVWAITPRVISAVLCTCAAARKSGRINA